MLPLCQSMLPKSILIGIGCDAVGRVPQAPDTEARRMKKRSLPAWQVRAFEEAVECQLRLSSESAAPGCAANNAQGNTKVK